MNNEYRYFCRRLWLKSKNCRKVALPIFVQNHRVLLKKRFNKFYNIYMKEKENNKDLTFLIYIEEILTDIRFPK